MTEGVYSFYKSALLRTSQSQVTSATGQLVHSFVSSQTDTRLLSMAGSMHSNELNLETIGLASWVPDWPQQLVYDANDTIPFHNRKDWTFLEQAFRPHEAIVYHPSSSIHTLCISGIYETAIQKFIHLASTSIAEMPEVHFIKAVRHRIPATTIQCFGRGGLRASLSSCGTEPGSSRSL